MKLIWKALKALFDAFNEVVECFENPDYFNENYSGK